MQTKEREREKNMWEVCKERTSASHRKKKEGKRQCMQNPVQQSVAKEISTYVIRPKSKHTFKGGLKQIYTKPIKKEGKDATTKITHKLLNDLGDQKCFSEDEYGEKKKKKFKTHSCS